VIKNTADTAVVDKDREEVLTSELNIMGDLLRKNGGEGSDLRPPHGTW